MSRKQNEFQEDEAGDDTATPVAEAPVESPPPGVLVDKDGQPEPPPDGFPPLSESDRRYLARRNVVETALSNVEAAKSDVAEAMMENERTKKELKGKEAALEAAWDALLRAEREEPAPEQGSLPFDGGGDGEASPELAEAQKAWDAKWDAFLDQGIEFLNLSESLVDKLRAHDPSVQTLRILTGIKAQSEGHGYTVIEGVGKGNADKIDDAYEKLLADFLAANPQPKAPTPAESPESAPGEFDFETTFPMPIDATANEDFGAEYHTEVRNDAIDEGTELAAAKRQLESGMGENGKALTDRHRTSLETKIGELQFQFDEEFSTYAEHFGQRAADALRRYVEAAVEKKSNLKGGIE